MEPSNQMLTQPTQPVLSERAQFIADQNRLLPVTEQGLLAGYFRADLVTPTDPTQDRAQQLSKIANSAFVQLSYEEGFPALQDGRPFWFKMDYEDDKSFACFETYVEQGLHSPRNLFSVAQSQELRALIPDLTSAQLREMYVLYYWKDRAKAFDLYQHSANRHIRQRRALQTDDYLYDKSTKLLESVIDVIDDPDFFDQLKYDPSAAFNAMEKLVKIRRVSAGLPSLAPEESNPNKGGSNQGSSTRVDIQVGAPSVHGGGNGGNRDIRGKLATPGHIIDEKGQVIPNNANFLKGALNDPETAKLLQEVVIRISTSQGSDRKPRWYKDVDPSKAQYDEDVIDASESNGNEEPDPFESMEDVTGIK